MRRIIISTMAVALAGCGDGGGVQSEPAALVSAEPAETAAVTAPIEPGVYEPYTRDQYPKTFATWGNAGVKRVDALRAAAAETVAKNPVCDKVAYAGLSDNRSQAPDRPIVFVDCENGQRFYLGENDVGSSVASQTQKSSRFTRSELVGLCTQSVQSQLNFPSTFDQGIWTISSRQAPYTGNWVVEFDFKAKNAFGLELPASARCITTPEGAAEVTILPR
ncbi:hypothetical protein D3C72_387200 [compost metagenome]